MFERKKAIFYLAVAKGKAPRMPKQYVLIKVSGKNIGFLAPGNDLEALAAAVVNDPDGGLNAFLNGEPPAGDWYVESGHIELTAPSLKDYKQFLDYYELMRKAKGRK